MRKTVSKFALAAGVVLAMAFTFSCSPPDDGGGNPSSPSGGGGYTGSYGSITYEGQTYKTVKIGSQTWMAENLNYEAEGSKCHNNNPANCTKYGRLYNWETALTACPSGWHLPSDDEWTVLEDYVGDDAGTKLKSTSGWYKSGNGTDNYGFSALPGGCSGPNGGKLREDEFNGLWWSATKLKNDVLVFYRHMFYDVSGVGREFNYGKSVLLSVRCVQD